VNEKELQELELLASLIGSMHRLVDSLEPSHIGMPQIFDALSAVARRVQVLADRAS